MRVAFYAPMKPPDHPAPSGDRRMAQAFMDLLTRSGHNVELASRFRSYEGQGDPSRQRRLEGIGRRLANRYLRHGRSPELWFTYHLYHKAPDWLGASVARALRIPYVVAEASLADKQAHGRWAEGFAASRRTIAAADLVLAMTSQDLRGLQASARAERLRLFPPFLDAAPFLAESRSHVEGDPVLLAVAMMRPDVKSESYRLLAGALCRLVDLPWRLVLVGDGAARAEVAAKFAIFGERVFLRGLIPAAELPAVYAAADLYVWPACGEAYGMAFLEAQAAGLPVVAGREGGVPDVVAHGRTGLLVEPRSEEALAAAIRALLSKPERRLAMSAAARSYVVAQHDMPRAVARLNEAFASIGVTACASA